MNCKVCHSEACTKPQFCDDLIWVVPVIKELCNDVHNDPVKVREGLEEQIRLTDDEFFLMWRAAELLQGWRTKKQV